jgi:trk system potassium uptake protein TrkA
MFGDSSKKFAVIGLGLFGKKLARELSDLGHEVLAVDVKEDPVSAVRDEVSKAVITDVKQEGIFEELITKDFEAVIVTMATDLEANLLSVLHAREIGVKRVIAKSGGPEHTTILKRLGIDNIISPEEDVAEQLAEKIGNPMLEEYMEFENGHSVAEITVPEAFVGKKLKDLDLREEYRVQVLGVQRAGHNEIDYVPSPDEPFQEGDFLWLWGPDESLQKLAH